MYGLLLQSEDGLVTITIVPNPSNNLTVLMTVTIGEIVFPPIPLPVPELEQVLEARSGF